MNIRTLSVGMIETQCYILWNDDREDCVIIDPGAEAGRILSATGGRRIAAILLTHGHFDHIAAVREIMEAAEKTGEKPRLMIHALDAPMLRDSSLNAGMSLMGVDVTAPEPTDFVDEGDKLNPGGISFEVLHTPGHTPGSVCYIAENEIFTGDTLFHHGWGRTDLPGGSEEDMMKSLRRLIKISDGYTVHPGHED